MAGAGLGWIWVMAAGWAGEEVVVPVGGMAGGGAAAAGQAGGASFWTGPPAEVGVGWFVPSNSPLKKLYLGAGYGGLFTNLSNAYDDGSVSNVREGDAGMAWSVFIGYNFNDYVGVEGGFATSDDIDYAATSDGSGDSWVAGEVSGDYESKLWTLAVVGRYPVTSRLTLFAKLGLVHWESKETFNENGFISTNEDSGTEAGIGGGFEYDLGVSDRFKVRGDFGYHHNGEHGIDVGSASVGVVYEFP